VAWNIGLCQFGLHGLKWPRELEWVTSWVQGMVTTECSVPSSLVVPLGGSECKPHHMLVAGICGNVKFWLHRLKWPRAGMGHQLGPWGMWGHLSAQSPLMVPVELVLKCQTNPPHGVAWVGSVFWATWAKMAGAGMGHQLGPWGMCRCQIPSYGAGEWI
jgi:hypothetical protein